MRRSWLFAGVLGVVIVAAMVAGGFLAVAVAGDDDAPASTPAAVASTPASGDGSTQTPAPSDDGGNVSLTAIEDLPELVERVMPSVVAISTVSGSGIRQAQGLGTGVVVDKDGHILTNYHVVEGARDVRVEFSDGTVAQGTVIGSDPGNDLAIVRVDLPEDALTPATFADSDQVRPGESVFAIGNPFSQKFTVTSGIISAIERDSAGNSLSGRPVRGMLQTDTAVNPGNSGGPLFNAAGQVVGINTSIENPTGQRVFVGVGFAVSSNTAQRFLPDMIAGNPITHPQLGVAGATLNEINAAAGRCRCREGRVHHLGVAGQRRRRGRPPRRLAPDGSRTATRWRRGHEDRWPGGRDDPGAGQACRPVQRRRPGQAHRGARRLRDGTDRHAAGVDRIARDCRPTG